MPSDPLQDLCSPAILAAYRARARARGQPLDRLVGEELGVEPQRLLDVLAVGFHFPSRRLDGQVPKADFSVFPAADSRRMGLLLSQEGGVRCGYVSDPLDVGLQRLVEARLGVPVRWTLVLESELQRALEQATGGGALLSGTVGTPDGGAQGRPKVEDISLAALGETTSPVVRLVHTTLYEAMSAGASDVHLESDPAGLAVRFRVDGALMDAGRVDGTAFCEQVISRVKVMAELDITERRIPQDGRLKVRIRERDVDLRVSVMPSLHGEDAVLRILDKEYLSDQLSGLTLDRLGFEAGSIALIRDLARQPYGMLLITGPTGSGKTTTLYAALSEINRGQDKIVTIEDPVEYQLPGVLQVPVNERKGLSFERGLRSILRHDPDKIMVGEIRDGETARIAVQAALTGHLVFSTVHANSVFDVLDRMEHMGVDAHGLVSALNGIVAQRLIRLVCPHCGQRVRADRPLMRAVGCKDCRQSGYKGRTAIAECMVLDDELRELIASRAPIREVKAAARARGTRSLRELAGQLAERGLTTPDEVDRVTRAE